MLFVDLAQRRHFLADARRLDRLVGGHEVVVADAANASILRRLPHDVGERDDAGQPAVAVEHRQAVHLALLHEAEGGLDVVVDAAGMDLARHRVAHGDRLGRLVLRRRGHADVAVRDHAHDATIVHDGSEAAVLPPHHHCRLGEVVLGPDGLDVRVHQVSDFHREPPLCGSLARSGPAVASCSDGVLKPHVRRFLQRGERRGPIPAFPPRMRRCLIVLALLAMAPSARAAVTVSVDPALDRKPVSPWIYGVNFGTSAEFTALPYPLRRWGGNSTTRYSWTQDAHNSGSDWYFITSPSNHPDPSQLPNGSEADLFVAEARAHGADAIVTLPLIGWSPKDREKRWGFSVAKYGAQDGTECTGSGGAWWCAAD